MKRSNVYQITRSHLDSSFTQLRCDVNVGVQDVRKSGDVRWLFCLEPGTPVEVQNVLHLQCCRSPWLLCRLLE